MGVRGLINFPELQFVEKGSPSLEFRIFEDVFAGTRPVIGTVHHIEVTPDEKNTFGVKKGGQSFQLKLP